MSKTLAIRLLACGLALGGLWIGLTQQAGQQPPLTIEKVKEDLYVIVGSGGNVGVLTTPGGVVLVDDKFDQNIPEILQKVKSVSDKPIKYVLNTHHHGDHTGGNAKLIENTEIICHRNARANLVRQKQPGAPRVTFSDETSVFLGGKEVRARYFGSGHTNGDVVILFPEQRTVHMGDLFITRAPFIDYGSGGSGLQWINTLEEVLKLDFDTVIPGHGPVVKREDLANWRKSFLAVTERTRELRKQGKSKEEAVSLLKMDDLPLWTPSGMWTGRSFPGLYDEIGR